LSPLDHPLATGSAIDVDATSVSRKSNYPRVRFDDSESSAPSIASFVPITTPSNDAAAPLIKNNNSIFFPEGGIPAVAENEASASRGGPDPPLKSSLPSPLGSPKLALRYGAEFYLFFPLYDDSFSSNFMFAWTCILGSKTPSTCIPS
jgi:hypothetical protein